MDELKKDELQGDIEPEAAHSEVSPDDEKAVQGGGLAQELDDLRDLFQQELDKATEKAARGETDDETDGEAEDEGELIQALEDVSCCDDEVPAGEEKICECCGENPCSNEYGEDYPYCDSCRELMKRYPLRISGIIMAVLMIAVFALSAYFSVEHIDHLSGVASAAQLHRDGKIISSMSENYTYVFSTDPKKVAKRSAKDLFDAFIKTGYYSDAATLVETLYDEDDLKKPWNKKYRDFLKENEELVATYYATMDVTQDVLNGKEYDYDKVMSELDALLTASPIEDGQSETAEKYNSIFIEYYKYVVMSLHGESLESQLEQLAKVDSMNKDGLDWVYISNYCAVAAKLGKEDLARELYERAIAINKQDVNAYNAFASYYRYAETPNADKMLEICNLAKENAYGNDYSYTTNLVIAYLLKGEAETAFETMKSYVSTTSYTIQSCNLFALCALEADNQEAYDEMVKVLASADYEISDLIKKYQKGELTLVQVLSDNGGEI